MAEFIYQMYQARKAHGDKVILDDVTLSFYPGAKIGVVGPNGMGKSTLLKIMVILDDVTLSFYPGAKIGVVGPNGMGKSTLLKIMAGSSSTT